MGELLTKDSKLGDYKEIEPKEDESKSAIVEPEPPVIVAQEEIVQPEVEPVVIPQEPTAKERATAAIEKMNQPIPRPEFDSTTPEYLKRTAKLGALSKGFSALGDVLSLSQGGNVNTPKKDTETGKYVDKYFKYLDDYKKQNDDYAYRDWQNQQRLNQVELGQANREAGIDESTRRYDEGVEFRGTEVERTQGNADRTYEAQQKAYDEAPQRAADQYKVQAQISADMAEAKRTNSLADWYAKESYKLQFDKAKNQYILFDDNRKPIAALNDEGDIQKLYNIIMNDADFGKEAGELMDKMKSELGEGISMNQMKVLVSKYFDKVDGAKQYLGINEKKNYYDPVNRPAYVIPGRGEKNSAPAEKEPVADPFDF